MKKVILIISIDASRTGTPLLLLNYLKWFKKHSEHQFILVLHHGGELLAEFQSVVKVFLLDEVINFKTSRNRIAYLVFKVFKKIFRIGDGNIIRFFFRRLRHKYSPHLIYVNSARNGEVLKNTEGIFKCKILTHVHEGEKVLNHSNRQGYVTYNLMLSDELIAVSESVKKVLVEKFKVDRDITVIPGGVAVNPQLQQSRDTILRREGIPEDSTIIMCCGWLGWQKGMDFFIQIARILSSHNDTLHFIWVGANELSDGYSQLIFDIEKLHLGHRISVIPSKKNIPDYLNLAEIFLMLSREESFSLVTAEAGLLGKPVICFEGSGGPCEIVNHDPRYMVPYGDINALCEKVINLLENKQESKQMGEYLHRRVVEHYSLEKSAAALLKVINNQIANLSPAL